MAELDGRRALVTGAAQGLGRAIAGLLAERGARVMVADIDVAGAERAAAELGPGAAWVGCDVTRSDEVEAAVRATVEQLGGLDILVNNAGIEIVKPLFDQTEAEFDRLMDVNVKGVFLGMKHAVPAMAAAGAGRS